MNRMQKHNIETMMNEYDPDNDHVPGQPTVTWTDHKILGLLIDFMEKVEKLEVEIQQLKEKRNE